MRNFIFLIFFILFSCKKEYLPKPKAFLSLNYSTSEYKKLHTNTPYTFEVPKETNIQPEPNYWIKISYPKLKATLDITYRPVENNLKELLIEAQKLVFKHTIKADEIISKDYINFNKRVFGSVYEITGNSASNLQFHATDSTDNFIKGVLYFQVKPNYDSVVPAIDFIKKDIIQLLETLQWKSSK